MTERLYLGGNTFPDYSDQPKPTVAAPWMQLTPDGNLNAYDFTGLTKPGRLFSMTQIDHLDIILPDAISCDHLAEYCNALTSLTIDAPLTVDITALIGNCAALKEVTLNFPNATSARWLANGCVNLKKVHATWPKIQDLGGAFNNTAMDADALNEVFESLPSWDSGRHNIEITGSVGAADCDVTIAEQKGWTVLR